MIPGNNRSVRKVLFFGEGFETYFSSCSEKTKKKFIMTLWLIEELSRVPVTKLKKLTNANGLYEIRVKSEGNEHRALCFFNSDNELVVVTGFQKKSQKTPRQQIINALYLKRTYENIKKQNNNP